MNSADSIMPRELSLPQVTENLEHLGVPFPPVPKSLTDQLQPISELALGSQQTTTPIYNLEAFVSRLSQPWPEDYIYFGVSGRGINSRALHYYLLTEHCAIFIQRALPVLPSSAPQLDDFCQLMAQAAELSCDPKLERESQALVVVDSDLLYSRIGRVENNQLNWQQEMPRTLNYARHSI